MACLSSGKQGVGVYLVSPLSSAALAASLMNAGVSKSGSPAPNPTTSTPAFFSAAALALTARVIDSETRLIRSASGNMGGTPARAVGYAPSAGAGEVRWTPVRPVGTGYGRSIGGGGPGRYRTIPGNASVGRAGAVGAV